MTPFNTSFIPTSIPAMDNVIASKRAKQLATKQADSYVTTPEGEIKGLTLKDQAVIPPSHYTADRDPTKSDDFLDGWREGSRWYNVVENKSWVCVESTRAGTLWRLMENLVMFPETLEFPLPVVALGNNLYKISMPSGKMINNILRVYIKNQCTFTSGFNYKSEDLSVTLDLSDYPQVNLDGKQAYVTCVRREVA